MLRARHPVFAFGTDANARRRRRSRNPGPGLGRAGGVPGAMRRRHSVCRHRHPGRNGFHCRGL